MEYKYKKYKYKYLQIAGSNMSFLRVTHIVDFSEDLPLDVIDRVKQINTDLKNYQVNTNDKINNIVSIINQKLAPNYIVSYIKINGKGVSTDLTYNDVGNSQNYNYQYAIKKIKDESSDELITLYSILNMIIGNLDTPKQPLILLCHLSGNIGENIEKNIKQGLNINSIKRALETNTDLVLINIDTIFLSESPTLQTNDFLDMVQVNHFKDGIINIHEYILNNYLESKSPLASAYHMYLQENLGIDWYSKLVSINLRVINLGIRLSGELLRKIELEIYKEIPIVLSRFKIKNGNNPIVKFKFFSHDFE